MRKEPPAGAAAVVAYPQRHLATGNTVWIVCYASGSTLLPPCVMFCGGKAEAIAKEYAAHLCEKHGLKNEFRESLDT